MCKFLEKDNLHRFESSSRSVRIAGHSTSIRLEAVFWEVLDGLATAEGVSIARLVTTLHDEAVEAREGSVNLASVLRAVCVMHLEARAARP